MPARPRRRALDARLVIGLALVIASIAGVVAVIAAVDRRTPLYAAATALQPGDRLELDDLVERRAALDGAEGLYLQAGQLPEEGLLITRPIREGELIAVSALGEPRGLDATAIVVELGSPVSATVAPGSLVDVWTATPVGDGLLATPPRVLVAEAIVVEVHAEDGLMAASGAVSVELLVPRAQLARLLQAVADDAELAIVPAGLPWATR